MKRFLGDDFLLDSKTAIDLYETFARRQPIIDYHCHLSPHQVADDYKWRSITEIWLQGDHYKWRAMRTAGVPERSITGDASDWDKFAAWAATVPQTLRNPLYHWTHLELAFPFGVTGKLLGPDTAKEIYEHCNRKLAEPAFTAQGLLAQYNVKVVCSTDDPIDDLEPHRRHAKNTKARTKLCPTWRPDKALAISIRLSRRIGKAALSKATAKAAMTAHRITTGDMVGSGTPKPAGISLGICRASTAAMPTPRPAPMMQGRADSSTTMMVTARSEKPMED